MSATSYQIILKNNSTSAYHFGVYQDYPTSPGLKSVVWQVRGLGPGATNKVSWKLQYGVAIADWDEDESSYSGQQIVNASLGSAYQAVTVQTDIPVIDPIPLLTGGLAVSADQIKLQNNTSMPFELGFAVHGKLIAVSASTGNQWANFIVHPTYYVALFRNVKEGSLVDSDLQVGPVEVAFTDGYTKAVVECTTVNGRDILTTTLID